MTLGDPTNEQWYFCLDHQRVEPDFGCRNDVRLGPFPTRDEAERALDRVEERNEEWESDPAWSDDDEP
ncbi:MAG TPA: hypothetical protein VIA81_06445 [Acidimicrobiia bacterium]